MLTELIGFNKMDFDSAASNRTRISGVGGSVFYAVTDSANSCSLLVWFMLCDKAWLVLKYLCPTSFELKKDPV